MLLEDKFKSLETQVANLEIIKREVVIKLSQMEIANKRAFLSIAFVIVINQILIISLLFRN
jgi:hypothetical protein